MIENEYDDLKEKLLEAPDTLIAQAFKDKLKLINFGECDLLKEWIEEAVKSPFQVSNFTINSIGFGLYNPMKESLNNNRLNIKYLLK